MINENEFNDLLSKRNLFLYENINLNEVKIRETKIKLYDNDGYFYSLTIGSLRDDRIKKIRIVSKRNNYSILNIQNYLKINNSNTILLSDEYISEKHKLKLQCGKCGKIYYNTWNHIQSMHEHYCEKCGRKSMAEKQTYSDEYIESELNKYGFSLLKNNGANNICVVDKNGYKFQTTLFNIKKFKKNSKMFIVNNPYVLDNIELYLKSNEIPVRLYRDKIDFELTSIKTDKLPFICCECGNIYYTTFDAIKINYKFRCDKCSKSKSKLEFIVEEYIKKLGIKYETQKRFKGCKNIRCLPFDFYLCDYNTVIEVNGEQHYYENKLFDMSLEERQRIDNIKKKYCEDNGIGFVELPYWNILNKTICKPAYQKKIDNIIS